MTRSLYDCLSEVHHIDDLEAVLDFVAERIRAETGWATALITFYFGDDVYYGAAGCPTDVKDRFRESYLASTTETRQRKRAAFRRYRRPGTNICFIPAGEGPRPSSAYFPSATTAKDGNAWEPHDRLLIMMHDWQDRSRGILTLDNPRSGQRPDEAEFERLIEIDRFVNVVAKIAENRFWSLRLAESEAAYRGIFDAATDGMLITDDKGTLIEANRAACRLHGYEYEDLIGRPTVDLVHPDDWPTLAETMKAIGEGRECLVEGRSVRKDGTAFDVEVRAVAFQYRAQRCMLVVLQDVTQRRRVLARLIEQQKDESVVAVAGGVAHDFNNLLLGITGPLDLLTKALPVGGAAHGHAERIADVTNKLARLTGQLLAVARGVHSEPRPLSIGSVIEENLRLIRGMVEVRHHLEMNVAPGLWPVHADRVQLGQVLINLSQNACEAMDQGGRLSISASNAPLDHPWLCPQTGRHEPGEYVRITVEDSGPGVDAPTRARLFEPYFSTKPSGSGLGLAAVLGIVRRHHGAIQFLSEPGRGTWIEILLPRSPGLVEDESPPARPPTEGTLPYRVLLVDDDEIVREVAEMMLGAVGCVVVAAESGEQAIEAYETRKTPFDLVMLDVSMPGMTGAETCGALRKIDPDVRVLFTSGHAEASVIEGVQGTGPISGFLQKPYALDDLRNAIARATR